MYGVMYRTVLWLLTSEMLSMRKGGGRWSVSLKEIW